MALSTSEKYNNKTKQNKKLFSARKEILGIVVVVVVVFFFFFFFPSLRFSLIHI